MDIKKVIASMSGIELFFMVAGIIVPVIFIVCIFFPLGASLKGLLMLTG